MSASPTLLQTLVLVGFSAVIALGADKAFGSPRAPIPRAPSVLVARRAATRVQLRADQVALEALRVDASAQRWLTATSLVEEGASDDASETTEEGRDIPRVATPLDESALAKALAEGHELAFGEAPSDARLGVAWAHVALENGRGKEIYCNNFGNIGATKEWQGPYYVRLLRERIKRNPDVWKYVPVRFRAFATPAEGARAYWQLVNDHWGSALAYFDAGYAFEAARKLSANNYATALLEPYALSMNKLYQEYRSRLSPVTAATSER